LRVSLSFDEETNEVVVEVADNGQGIPADVLPHVFDPFYTTKRAGAGLGLAVCYGIVTAHGGRVAVESGGGQKGTAVRVSLPADEAASGLAPRPHVVQTSHDDLRFEISNLKL
ncbi:MAG TPA: HAMP domain-containing sensor histidine kinase, partial [Pyrinomonadaceae bacterium]